MLSVLVASGINNVICAIYITCVTLTNRQALPGGVYFTVSHDQISFHHVSTMQLFRFIETHKCQDSEIFCKIRLQESIYRFDSVIKLSEAK